MDADVTISHNSRDEYSLSSNFENHVMEAVCFSYIVDQILSDISSEGRQENTFANILSCFHRSGNDTWEEIKRHFGGYEEKEYVQNPNFKARYSLYTEEGWFSGKTVHLDKEYKPQNPRNLDGKVSVSTTLYAIHLGDTAPPDGVDLIKDILRKQLGYYKSNGFPSVGNRGAPAEVAESVLRY